jgi:hypothetical protein
MKWIGKGKAWIYVNDDDSVIDRVIYESGVYQSMRHCRSYVSLSGMKKYIELEHAKRERVGELKEYVLTEEKPDYVLSFLKIVTYAVLTILFLVLFTIIFCNKAHAENRAISDMLNAYARQPIVIIVQPNNFVPNPPAYLPPVRGQVLEQADFGGARLHETESINLLGSDDE